MARSRSASDTRRPLGWESLAAVFITVPSAPGHDPLNTTDRRRLGHQPVSGDHEINLWVDPRRPGAERTWPAGRSPRSRLAFPEAGLLPGPGGWPVAVQDP